MLPFFSNSFPFELLLSPQLSEGTKDENCMGRSESRTIPPRGDLARWKDMTCWNPAKKEQSGDKLAWMREVCSRKCVRNSLQVGVLQKQRERGILKTASLRPSS